MMERQQEQEVKRLQGKIAIVTSSNPGIIQATAIEFAKEEANVIILPDTNYKSLMAWKQQIYNKFNCNSSNFVPIN